MFGSGESAAERTLAEQNRRLIQKRHEEAQVEQVINSYHIPKSESANFSEVTTVKTPRLLNKKKGGIR